MSAPRGAEMRTVALQAPAGGFLSADGGGGGAVTAGAAAIGEWERFVVGPPPGLLESGAAITLATLSGYYVCAEGGGGSLVTANRPVAAEWERFTLQKLGGEGAIRTGDRVGLRAHGGPWIAAENGGGGRVLAIATQLSDDAAFVCTVMPGPGGDVPASRPRAVRVVFEYRGGAAEVRGQELVAMRPLPAQEFDPAEAQGAWVDVRDPRGQLTYRRAVQVPLSPGREIPGEEGAMQRLPPQGRRGRFDLVVPFDEPGGTIELVATPPQPRRAPQRGLTGAGPPRGGAAKVVARAKLAPGKKP